MAEPHPFMCVACGEGFTPPDGVVNMVRRNPTDHGYPMCSDCFASLFQQGALSRDSTALKCVCGSKDRNRTICPIHLVSNQVH